jgi:dATP pyrophosphohydrolase
MNLRHHYVQCHVLRAAPGTHEFLQLRRAPGEFMAGTWQIVNGRIESGEKAWQTALRELREETGLEPLEFYQLDTVNTFYLASDDAIWYCPGFCAIAPAGTAVILDAEHDSFRWVPRDQIDSQLMWPGERQALAEIFREILGNGLAKPHLRLAIPPRRETPPD